MSKSALTRANAAAKKLERKIAKKKAIQDKKRETEKAKAKVESLRKKLAKM